MDSFEGDPESPGSLHRYLYSVGDPVDKADPSGQQFTDVIGGLGNTAIDAMAVLRFLSVVTAVSATLFVTAGLTSLVAVRQASQDTSGEVARARAQAQAAVEDAADDLEKRPKRILFHYGSPDEVEGIFASGEIGAAPESGSFPAGAFATDIAGYLAESLMTRSQLTKIIFGQNETDISKTAWYVAFAEYPRYTFQKIAPFIYFHEAPVEIIPLAYGPTLLGER